MSASRHFVDRPEVPSGTAVYGDAAPSGFSGELSALARERDARVKAEAANRAKDDFLAMLAHELRQPLAAAFPALEVQKRSLSPERRERAGELIEAQLSHIARLVEDLADTAQISRGTIELHRQRLDLRTVVSQAIDMNAAAFDRRQHTRTVALGGEPVWVSGDATRLKQVFSNLLHNAGSYTPPGGAIAASLDRAADQAIFRLRDNGPGIPAHALERIFEPFERGPHAGPGMGIGLAVVRRLVELHGGAVAVRSVGSEQGSEFVVTLPLDERQEQVHL